MEGKIMTDKEVFKRYGQPNDWNNYVKFYPPFQMFLAWNKGQSINYFYCHELIHSMLEKSFDEINHCFSYSGIKNLGLHLYGGCFNYRKMRGSSSRLSRHSWAIALDLHPEANKLSWKADKASFAHEDFKEVIDIFYDAGFINYGIEKGYDWMHFEPSL